MTDPKPDSLTQFHACESLRELVTQTVGAGTRPTNWMSEGTTLTSSNGTSAFQPPLPATYDKIGRPCIFNEAAASEIVDDSMFQLAEIIELRARDFYENVLAKNRIEYPTMAHVIDALVGHIMEGEQ